MQTPAHCGARILLRKSGLTLIAFITLAVILDSFPSAQSRSTNSGTLAFTHVTVVDGTGAEPKLDFTLVIDADMFCSSDEIQITKTSGFRFNHEPGSLNHKLRNDEVK